MPRYWFCKSLNYKFKPPLLFYMGVAFFLKYIIHIYLYFNTLFRHWVNFLKFLHFKHFIMYLIDSINIRLHFLIIIWKIKLTILKLYFLNRIIVNSTNCFFFDLTHNLWVMFLCDNLTCKYYCYFPELFINIYKYRLMYICT